MKFDKRLLVVVVLILGLLLVACSGEESAVEESAANAEVAAESDTNEEVAEVEEQQPDPEPTKAPEPEPTAVPEPVEEEAVVEEPVEVGELSEEALSAAFITFIEDMERYGTIGLEDANAALAEDPPPFLLDVRETSELEEKGHIESAVHIPLRELAQHSEVLPSKDTPIIAYCGSGWRATIAMAALEAMGYEDVQVLKGGSFGGWVEAGYPTVEGLPPEALVLEVADIDPAMLATMDEMLSAIPEGWGVITAEQLNTELAENPGLTLIDVRTEGEVVEKGSLDAENVTFIPIEQFEEMKEMWPADKDEPIVVYCGSGHRSTIAMTILMAHGYTDVRSLKGGFGGWAEAGYPVAGGAVQLDNAFATFIDDMEAYGTISLEDTNAALAEDPAPFLLDVREFAESEANGHIEGAVQIPLRELAQNLDKLPSFDTLIIAYCGSGWRATIAMAALEALGWEDVKVMKGGSFGGWVEAGYPVVEGVPPEAEALNAAEPDPDLVAKIDAALSGIPEGWGVITAETLNTEIVENPDLILIDVRTPGEVATKGSIDAENVIFIPIEAFVTNKDMWPADKEAPIVVYCGSGHRSTIAMTILWANGYTDVRSLKGGFGGWAEAGYPVKMDTEALDAGFAEFLADMEAYNTIGLDDLNLALGEDPPPFILDVRQPEELEANGHIEGAVNIPLREVADNIELLPSFETPIVSYCSGGWRCTIAAAALEALGWQDVKALKGNSFTGWVEGGYPVVEGPAQEALVLDVAEPDAVALAQIQKMLRSVPEGFGVITADEFNTQLVENPDLIVIDVRRSEELAENGVIAADNWIHIPLEEFMANQADWPADKGAPIVVYCGSGHRSTIAMAILWSYGYTDVHSLQGGFGGWVEAGYPVAEFAAP